MRFARLLAASVGGTVALGLVACVSLSGLSGGGPSISDASRDGVGADSRVDGHDARPHVDATATDVQVDTNAEDGADGRVISVTDGGPFSACPSFTFFCDGFETGDFSRWDTPLGGSGADLTVDSVRVLRGRYSAHASALVAGTDGAFVSGSRYAVKKLPEPLSKDYFGMRAYLYLPETQAQSTAYFAVTADDGSALDIGIDLGPLSVAKAAYTPDAVYPADVTAPTGRWTCFEWVIYIAADMSGHLSLFQDGVAVLDTAAVTLPPGGNPFTAFELGYVSELGALREEAFFDDVALATARVGCER